MYSVPDDLPVDTRARLPAIMEGVKRGKDNEQMAAELGVSQYVVAYDRLLWRRSEGYEVWVYEEFHRLHAIVADKNPIVAYKEMSHLLGRLIGQKIKAEIKAQGRIKVDVEAGESIESVLREYQDTIDKVVEEAVERAFSKDGAGEQVDPSETSPEAG